MLATVEARSPKGDLITFPLEDDSSGFRVTNIVGLGPVKANLVSTGFANADGEIFQSSRRPARNIKISLELEPDPTVETVQALRNKLYRVFMPESKVKLTFILEVGLSLDIVGVVEDCDVEHFTQQPKAEISIMCYGETDFIDPTPVVVPGFTVDDETNSMVIEYDGTINTGIQLVLNVDRALPEFTVYHVLPNDEIQTLEFDNYPLEAGDTLTISTVFGSKGATLLRAGTLSSVLYGISPQSRFIELLPGENSIRVYAEGDPIPLEVEYITKYGGL